MSDNPYASTPVPGKPTSLSIWVLLGCLLTYGLLRGFVAAEPYIQGAIKSSDDHTFVRTLHFLYSLIV